MKSNISISNLRQLIKDHGYVSVAIFMENVISDYYSNADSIGQDADFITAPEVSQLFGEMVGLWVAIEWQKMGSPKIALVELGPGKGTLMNDLLRATKNIDKFHQSISIYLVEKSEKLKAIQEENLKKWYDISFKWLDDFSEVPNIPTITFANEFFDALPIHQYVKIKNEWYENVVTTIVADGEFCFSTVPVSNNIQEFLNYEYVKADNRGIIEISPFSTEIIKKISKHLVKNSGLCLIIDYGYDYQPSQRIHYNSTLQAVKNHKYHPLLSEIGKADITAHVDFFALKQAAMDSDCKILNIISQRDFLLNQGILKRFEILSKNASNKEREILSEGLNRLISREKMGLLFKVLAFSGKNI